SIVLGSSPWCDKDDGLHPSPPLRRRVAIRPPTARCYAQRRDQSVPSLGGPWSLPRPHIHRRRVQLPLCHHCSWLVRWLGRATGPSDVRRLAPGSVPPDRASIPQIHRARPLDGVAFLPGSPPTPPADLSSPLP